MTLRIVVDGRVVPDWSNSVTGLAGAVGDIPRPRRQAAEIAELTPLSMVT